jgi:hypothetical protein
MSHLASAPIQVKREAVRNLGCTLSSRPFDNVKILTMAFTKAQ